MNNLQKFDNFVMGYATPVYNKLNDFVTKARVDCEKGALGDIYNKCGEQISNAIRFDPVSFPIKIALAVAPVSVCLFAAISSLSTPALVLVSAAGTAAFLTLPNLLSKDGKLVAVASSLSVTVAFTAIKVMVALAALDAGATLLTLTIGAGASVSMYAAYKWLTEEPNASETTETTVNAESPEIKDPT